MTYPWFRVYNEMVNDFKLARMTPEERWAWVALLCMANEAPVRGTVSLGDGIPFEAGDLAHRANIPETVATSFLEKAVKLKMIAIGEDGAIAIINFEKRQHDYPSDMPEKTRERKQKSRQQPEAVTDTPGDVTSSHDMSRAVTTQTRSDQIRSDQTRSDSESQASAKNADLPSQSLKDQFAKLLVELGASKNRPAKLQEIYRLCFGDTDVPEFSRLAKVGTQVGGAGRLAQLLWELSTRPPTGDVLAYILATEKGHKANGNRSNVQSSDNGTGEANGPDETARAITAALEARRRTSSA